MKQEIFNEYEVVRLKLLPYEREMIKSTYPELKVHEYIDDKFRTRHYIIVKTMEDILTYKLNKLEYFSPRITYRTGLNRLQFGL